MTNKLNTNDIRQLLNHSAGQLKPATEDGLREARSAAMLRHNPDAGARRQGVANWRHSTAAWVAMVLLTLGAVGGSVYYWQGQHDNSEVDLAILTGDLPAQVFVN